jgi:hypothetical protein
VPSLTRHITLAFALVCVCVVLPAGAAAQTRAASGNTGGAVFVPPPPPPKKAKIVNGKAIAPAGAPWQVRRAIEWANEIVEKPYRWGGGHRAFSSRRLDSGYDCSGAISHALRGARLVKSPLDSSGFMKWGRSGPGTWITVYAHSGHAYVVIAGLRFDTSMRDPDAPGPRTGPRWSKRLRKSASFQARHARGL